jgi:ABC-type molybdenum transport system ATPase subunit/photorepair protein PhrA
METFAPPILREVEIDELFGYLTYRIRLDGSDNLSLLYGENGSGKTTLLWLIYAALHTCQTKPSMPVSARDLAGPRDVLWQF